MSIIDKINKLIIGSDTKDLEKTRKALQSLKDITKSNSVELASFSELIKSLYNNNSNGSSSQSIYSTFENIIKELGLDFSEFTIDQDRLSRYKEYDSIVRKIPYMKRALKVIVQNVLNPEDYTKKSLHIIYENENTPEDISMYIQETENLLDFYELEDYIYDVVYSSLKYGDYFVEIVLLPEILKQHNLLNESTTLFEGNINNKKVNLNITFENNLFNIDSKLKKYKLQRNDIFLNYLSPEYVIKLGDRFCLGYIVLNNANSQNILPDKRTTMQFFKSDLLSDMTKKILQKVQQSSTQINNLLKTENDLKFVLAKYLAINSQQNNQNSNIVLRFVPEELMVHFTTDKTEFRPYGTSIFYGSEFLSKIVVAIQASIMVQRLTRSIEKRVIRVDLGTSRDARRYLTEVKSMFNRRKYTVDNIGTLDEIPSHLTTFEDIYIPVKNGKSPIEFETLPPVGDLATRVEDLKQLRDHLVASVDVPPPYLGIEENTESKAQLSQENVVFAISIANYQKSLLKSFNKLLKRLFNLLSFNDSVYKDIKLTFDPPVSIALEHKSDYLQTISSIIESLSNLGISKTYLINKYIPEYKDYQEQKTEIEEKIENVYKKTNNNENNENEFSGFGGTGNEEGGL